MRRWPILQRAIPSFWFVGVIGALSACSSQTSPASGARTPTANGAPLPAPASSGAATSGVDAGPAPSAPSGSAEVPAPPVPSAEAPALPRARAPVGKLCGGFAGILCADTLYCSFPVSARCGAGDMAGTCKVIPDLCTMEFAPVCGCDGKTYGSACVAARGGVSVAKTGACAADGDSTIADGKTCGTRGVNGQCANGSYCAYRSQCGSTDAGGTCLKKPALCPHLVAPVCGCDNQSYNNACEAARAGVSVAATGSCKVH